MLSNLQRLDLSNTEISGTIPREISMLSNLQELYLSQHADQWHNSSRDIDAEQFAGYCSLYNTQISGTIPREISMLSNLSNRRLAQFLRYRC